jgi:hypothetical protein
MRLEGLGELKNFQLSHREWNPRPLSKNTRNLSQDIRSWSSDRTEDLQNTSLGHYRYTSLPDQFSSKWLILSNERILFNWVVMCAIFYLKSDACASLSISSSHASSINLHSHNIMSEHCHPRTGLKNNMECSFYSRQQRVRTTLNSNTVQSK